MPPTRPNQSPPANAAALRQSAFMWPTGTVTTKTIYAEKQVALNLYPHTD